MHKLRRFALRFFHSHSGATGVFCLICRTACILPVCSQSDSREQQDRRSQAKSGGFTNKNMSRPTLCITMSSIPCSRSVVVSVPLSRQRRHLERIQCI